MFTPCSLFDYMNWIMRAIITFIIVQREKFRLRNFKRQQVEATAASGQGRVSASGGIRIDRSQEAVYLLRFSPRPSSAPNSVPSPGRPRPTRSSWRYGRCTRYDSHRKSPAVSRFPR